MSATHTPGPWAVCLSADARSKGYVRPIVDGAVVCDVHEYA